MSTPTKTSQTAAKVLDVLAALLGHFAHGLTPTDLSKATGLDPSAITRHVATLEERALPNVSRRPAASAPRCSSHATPWPCFAASTPHANASRTSSHASPASKEKNMARTATKTAVVAGSSPTPTCPLAHRRRRRQPARGDADQAGSCGASHRHRDRLRRHADHRRAGGRNPLLPAAHRRIAAGLGKRLLVLRELTPHGEFEKRVGVPRLQLQVGRALHAGRCQDGQICQLAL